MDEEWNGPALAMFDEPLPEPPRWFEAGWVRPSVDAIVVVSVVVFTLFQLHPNLIAADTTPAGGDMGAHVWAPAYLRDHLLHHGRLTGWTPDWYAGFPAYFFYMVVPSLLIVLVNAGFHGLLVAIPLVVGGVLVYLGVVRLTSRRLRAGLFVAAGIVAVVGISVPYGIAFKVVTILGVLSLPIAVYAFGRLADLTWPTPALLSIASLTFLFNREPLVNNTGNIIGGNIASTMAGEFAFSISLSLAVLYLGVVIRGMRTARYRGLAAVLLALVALCHVIPAIWAVIATVFIVILWPGVRRLYWIVTVLPTAGLISAFWTMPFVWRRAYSNDMGWGKASGVRDLRPADTSGVAHRRPATDYLAPDKLKWVLALAMVGVVVSIVFRLRAGICLTVLTASMGLMFWLWPEEIRLWNARLLPFWLLGIYLLAGLGVGELGKAVASLVAANPDRPVFGVNLATPAVALGLAMIVVGLPLRVLPFGTRHADGSYEWASIFHVSSADRNVVSDWAAWNYKGYERKDYYPEYYGLISTMGEVGRDHGCGRAMWEYDNDTLNRYGTPMAPMLLPFWTDGCIGSMEGLYFEASATTPYHFINQSELSTKCSCAQNFRLAYAIEDSPYQGFQIDRGIQHLQILGVRYYLAFSKQAVAAADQHPDLTPVATTGPWHVYEVADAPLVASLTAEPAVLTGVDQHKGWVQDAVAWYMDTEAWDVPLAADGPSTWQRIRSGEQPDERRVDPVEVTNIKTGDDRISFDVDRPGVPVLVKTSYFPNWQASGADGPYRVTPNLMVVVPTSGHVSLHFGWTPVDAGAWAFTLVGIALAVLLALRPPIAMPESRPRRGRRAERAELEFQGETHTVRDGELVGMPRFEALPDPRM